MKALVAGATGQTGRRIVQVLCDRQIPVKAMVRDRAKAVSLFPSSVEIVEGDVLKPATLRAAIADCTVLLCATGATPSFDAFGPYQVDYVGTKNLVDVAQAQHIEQFVLVSSLCVSKFFHPLNLFWLVLFWKHQAEAYLQASGVPYTIVRPGGLRNDDAPDPMVMAAADTLFEGSIPRQKVAEVAVAALFEPAARQKIAEIVTRADAPAQDWGALFAGLTVN